MYARAVRPGRSRGLLDLLGLGLPVGFLIGQGQGVVGLDVTRLRLGGLEQGLDGHVVLGQFDVAQAQLEVPGPGVLGLGLDVFPVRVRGLDVVLGLFIGQAEDVKLPDFEPKTCSKSGAVYFKKDCDDCRMIYWRLGKALVVAVTDDKDIDLTQFMPALASL